MAVVFSLFFFLKANLKNLGGEGEKPMSEGFWHQFFFGGFSGLNFPLRRNRFLPTSNVLNKLEQTELINGTRSPPGSGSSYILGFFFSLHGIFGNLENDLENVDFLFKRLDFLEKKPAMF